MSEQTFELKPVGVRYVCDACGKGEMKPHGQVAWLSDPVKYPHKCDSCGHEQNFHERYPTVRWVKP